MPRPTRYTPGGMLFHVLNRAVGRRTLFSKEADYLAFETVMAETQRVRPMRISAYCLMPNHWHLILWPEHDGDLSAFMQQLTNTHVKRWKKHHGETGLGPLYQGRFKCFPLQSDDYFYDAVRYVEETRGGPIWSHAPSAGAGRAYGCVSSGAAESAPTQPAPNWPPGRCRNRPIGVKSSIERKPRPNWRPCVAASTGAAPSATRHGPLRPPKSWASS